MIDIVDMFVRMLVIMVGMVDMVVTLEMDEQMDTWLYWVKADMDIQTQYMVAPLLFFFNPT